MRLSATLMALSLIGATAAGIWASGCTEYSTDCDLNLTCPPAPPPPAPVCAGLYIPGDCNDCLQKSCCQELSDCSTDTNGLCLNACIFGLWPALPECSTGQTKMRLDTLKACMANKCSPACDPKDMCNPVTNGGCNPSTAACDAVYPGMFACVDLYGAPAQACQPCDIEAGPYCGGGLRCHPTLHQCGHFCCNDMDCGTGRCELDPVKAIGATLAVPDQSVGICVTMDGTGIACDAPMMSPSMGICITDHP